MVCRSVNDEFPFAVPPCAADGIQQSAHAFGRGVRAVPEMINRIDKKTGVNLRIRRFACRRAPRR